PTIAPFLKFRWIFANNEQRSLHYRQLIAKAPIVESVHCCPPCAERSHAKHQSMMLLKHAGLKAGSLCSPCCGTESGRPRSSSTPSICLSSTARTFGASRGRERRLACRNFERTTM